MCNLSTGIWHYMYAKSREIWVTRKYMLDKAHFFSNCTPISMNNTNLLINL